MESQYLAYIVVGVTAGSIYALGATGLILTYKTSRIFNFAYGALATIAAYVFYWLHVQLRLPWEVAGFIAVVVVGVVLGVVFEPFARALSRRSLPEQVMATVGIFIGVQGVFIVMYGPTARTFPSYLPSKTFDVFGASISVGQIVIMGLSLVATGVLYAFFRRARLGVAMRGVVDNPELLDLAGTSPGNVRRSAWIIGSVFATLSGVLLAPSIQLNPTLLALLVVNSFGAAAFGAFTNLPMSYVGGLVIGIVGALIDMAVGSVNTNSVIAGIAPSLPFIALFGASTLLPRRWMQARHRVKLERSTWSVPGRLQLLAAIVILIPACFVPNMVGSDIGNWTQVLIYLILLMSLGLLMRTAGQVSLCHLTFAAIGAAAFGHLAGTDGVGVPWLVALVVSGLVLVPIGVVLAVPSIRLGGLYLALATFGFGILVQGMFYTSGLMFSLSAGLPAPLPSLWWLGISGTRGFYYVVLSVAVACSAMVVWLTRTRLGRLLEALADSPITLATNGASINVTRLLAFTISAFLAGVAGALWAVNATVVTATTFNPITSLKLAAVSLISVGGQPWAALVPSLGIVLLPTYIGGGNVTYYLQIFFGAGAIHRGLMNRAQVKRGLAERLDRWGGRRPVVTRRSSQIARTAQVMARKRPYNELQIDDLSVAFGGLLAVDELSLRAPAGQITGLIGPNGAGKTTAFNACSGLVHPISGRIMFGGHLIGNLSPAARARLGIGRTFQQMELFESLNVTKNVALGYEAAQAGRKPIAQLLAKRAEVSAALEAAEDALQFAGIAELSELNVGSLSTGQRRLVELARCLAGPFSLLLLDEPSSGLDRQETELFAEILKRVVDERGAGILLVEHDMSLVMDVCSYIYVMDFGRLLFEGTPAEVRGSSTVQNAYLGTRRVEDETQREPVASKAGNGPVRALSLGGGKASPLLELSSITAGYGSQMVLHDVDVDVGPGTIVALLGPNGAGKTTLLKVASGLLRAQRGRVRLAGSDVTSASAHERAALGLCLVPEGRGIFRSLTVAENLRLYRPPWVGRERVDEALAAFPALGSRLKEVAGNLSGGQQQMLALARVYVAEPKLVVCDELSMGLAPIVVDAIFDALRKFSDAGISMLIVEQYIERALDLCDRIFLMNRGSITFAGTPDQVNEDVLTTHYFGHC